MERLQIVEVVLGEHDLSKDPDCERTCKPVQRFDINPNTDVKVHEDYDPNNIVSNGNDIALIRLPRPAQTAYEDPDEIVMPICLGWNQAIRVPENKFIVAGWGRTSNDPFDKGDTQEAGAHSALQQKLEVPIISADECKSKFAIFDRINSERHICAGGIKGIKAINTISEISAHSPLGIGQDSCSGDSGGPLMSQRQGDFKQNKYLYGIVSFGTRKCGQVRN